MNETIEARSGELMSIPLSCLVPSRRNMRRTGGNDVAALKASIKAQGVLQNLIVCPAEGRKGKSGKYEVVGGGRRLQALQQLAKDGEIAKDEEILCRVKPTRDAAEASLAENIAREAMHPADEFEAFKRLVEEGKSVEEVAERFGVSVMTVKRRLKLADLHPSLLALYRANEITLDQLMALTLTDDQEEQLRVWETAPSWRRDAEFLRQSLLSQEIDAAHDPLAKFVGVEGYETAGGTVRRDLFDDEGAGYIQDAALLQRLAGEKLDAAAETVRAEGWSWVEVVAQLNGSELFQFQRCKKTRRPMSKHEAKKHETLSRRVQELDDRLDKHYEADDDSEAIDEGALDKLEREAQEAREALEAFEEELATFDEATLGAAGAIVCVGRQGQVEVHRGLMKPHERKVSKAAVQSAVDEGDATAPATPTKTHSAALMTELTAHHTLAARAAMLDQPGVAMAALLHCLVQRLLYEGYMPASTAVKLVPNAPDGGFNPQVSQALQVSKAWQAVDDAKRRWGERVPGDPDKLLTWLIALDENAQRDLLALCVALTLNGVSDLAQDKNLAALAGALSLDMADWWQATAEGYFSRVTKETTLTAIAEAAGPEAAAKIRGISKGELVRVAERDMAGRRWLPAPLRTGPQA